MRTAASLSLVLLASGFSFCLISLTNGDAINCAGGGCSLYADLEFMGLSFYAWGTMLFTLLIFAWGKAWFHHASILALGADIPFLVWQCFMVPCTSCLTVSVLLVLNACLARAPARAFRPVTGSTFRRLAIIAAIALIGCGFINILKETVFPWAINGQSQAGRTLFFSPSCEPCRRHIIEAVEAGKLSNIALIPIARSKDDFPAIHALEQAYAHSGYAGFQAAITENAAVEAGTLGIFERLELTLKLHWNHGHFARSGGTSLPWYSGPLEEAGPDHSPAVLSDVPAADVGCGVAPGQCSTANGGFAW